MGPYPSRGPRAADRRHASPVPAVAPQYLSGMAPKYKLNYDWRLIGPVKWTEDSIVTLQVDLHS